MKTPREIIIEMSFQSKFIKNKIEELQMEISEHAIMVFLGLLCGDTNVTHWKTELYSWLRRISKYKINGSKKLSVDTYFSILFIGPLSIGEKDWIVDLNEIIHDKNMSLILNKKHAMDLHVRISEFFKYICIELNKRGTLSKETFEEIINKSAGNI